MRALLIVAASAAAAFAALKLRESGALAGFLLPASPLEFARGIYTEMTMTNAAALEIPNVRAMLRVIRKGEGTLAESGYKRLVGGGEFASFDDHPRQSVYIPRLKIHSTAAGAYQFLSRTWDEVKRAAGLEDFSPRSQDLAAVQRMRDRGALLHVIEGRIDAALDKLSWEWASLPPFRYSGQGTLRAADAKTFFVTSGGLIGEIYA